MQRHFGTSWMQHTHHSCMCICKRQEVMPRHLPWPTIIKRLSVECTWGRQSAGKAQIFTWLSTVSFSSPSLGWIPFHSFEPSEKAHVLRAFRPSFWASLQTGGLTSANAFHRQYMMVISKSLVLQWCIMTTQQPTSTFAHDHCMLGTKWHSFDTRLVGKGSEPA